MQSLIAAVPSYWLIGVASTLTITQFVLGFFLCGPNAAVWEWLGWICMWGAGVFGMLPIPTFRKHGGVARGDSYIHTTSPVKCGIYAIVRHPQNGTAWILINLGIMLIIRHWSSYLTGTLAMLLVYLETYQADRRCIQKFGDSYRDYMAQVPRVNFIYGTLLLVKKRWGEKHR